MSTLELALTTVAANREGLAVAAWLGEAGVAAARATAAGSARWAGWAPVMQELMLRRAEVMEARTELARAGSNLNQLVRLAHTWSAHTGTADTPLAYTTAGVEERSGALPPSLVEALERIVDPIERAVARVEIAAAGIDELITAAGDELRSGGQR